MTSMTSIFKGPNKQIIKKMWCGNKSCVCTKTHYVSSPGQLWNCFRDLNDVKVDFDTKEFEREDTNQFYVTKIYKIYVSMEADIKLLVGRHFDICYKFSRAELLRFATDYKLPKTFSRATRHELCLKMLHVIMQRDYMAVTIIPFLDTIFDRNVIKIIVDMAIEF